MISSADSLRTPPSLPSLSTCHTPPLPLTTLLSVSPSLRFSEDYAGMYVHAGVFVWGKHAMHTHKHTHTNPHTVNQSTTHSLARSLTNSLARSFTNSLIHTPTQSLTPSLSHTRARTW